VALIFRWNLTSTLPYFISGLPSPISIAMPCCFRHKLYNVPQGDPPHHSTSPNFPACLFIQVNFKFKFPKSCLELDWGHSNHRVPCSGCQVDMRCLGSHTSGDQFSFLFLPQVILCGVTVLAGSVLPTMCSPCLCLFSSLYSSFCLCHLSSSRFMTDFYWLPTMKFSCGPNNNTSTLVYVCLF
jgi:hypothetical protein